MKRERRETKKQLIATFKLASLAPRGQIILLDSTSCMLFIMKTVTWQPVDEAPVAKVQVTVILPLSSITVVAGGWRPVVSV